MWENGQNGLKESISGEIIAVLAVGVALARLILNATRGLRQDIRQDIKDLRGLGVYSVRSLARQPDGSPTTFSMRCAPGGAGEPLSGKWCLSGNPLVGRRPGGTRKPMTDEREQLRFVEVMGRIVDSKRRRRYATGFHVPRELKSLEEVDSTRDWAEEMNRRGCQINIRTIRKNTEPYPDCLAEMDGEKIGIERTELVCREAIKAYPEIPWLEEPGPHFLDQLASLPKPPIFVVWTRDAFQKRLNEIVQDKDRRVKDGSLFKQFLLIVTDEDWLGEATLSEYLQTIKLQRPRHFDGIYVMGSYIPDPDGDGEGHYPVFEVPLAG